MPDTLECLLLIAHLWPPGAFSRFHGSASVQNDSCFTVKEWPLCMMQEIDTVVISRTPNECREVIIQVA